jgi:hypothetical protein
MHFHAFPCISMHFHALPNQPCTSSQSGSRGGAPALVELCSGGGARDHAPAHRAGASSQVPTPREKGLTGSRPIRSRSPGRGGARSNRRRRR